jgi:hypothetical protein
MISRLMPGQDGCGGEHRFSTVVEIVLSFHRQLSSHVLKEQLLSREYGFPSQPDFKTLSSHNYLFSPAAFLGGLLLTTGCADPTLTFRTPRKVG